MLRARWKDSPDAFSRGVKAAALVVSLVFSALLTAVALRTPDYHWLAWISFLPLFVVVRSLGCSVTSRDGVRSRPARVCHRPVRSVIAMPPGRPFIATLAGGFWGACLYLFSTAGPTPPVDTVVPAVGPSVWLLTLLIVIPSVYVGLAARRARAIGFNLLTLALGWTLVEAVLHLQSVCAPHEGLLTASQAEGPQFHWLARLLGYVSTALLVACANASLVGILSGARLRVPACPSLGGSPNIVGRIASKVVLAIQFWILGQAYPRAPPS